MIIKDSAQDDEDFIDGDSDGVGFSRSDVEVKSKACEDTCFESEGEVVWKELLINLLRLEIGTGDIEVAFDEGYLELVFAKAI